MLLAELLESLELKPAVTSGRFHSFGTFRCNGYSDRSAYFHRNSACRRLRSGADLKEDEAVNAGAGLCAPLHRLAKEERQLGSLYCL